jgi:hypothetical protein
LTPIATDKKSKHSAEASYWLGMVEWYQSQYERAFQAFDRAMLMGRTHNEPVWARYGLDFGSQMAQAVVKYDPERSYRWLDTLERNAQFWKNTGRFKGASDAIAVVFHESAFALLDPKKPSPQSCRSVRQFLERAASLNHSTVNFQYVGDKVIFMKGFRTYLNVDDQELAAAREQALQAIDTSPLLSAEAKRQQRELFEKQWNK